MWSRIFVPAVKMLTIVVCIVAAVVAVNGQQSGCGGSITVTAGAASIIRSPNFPNDYSNNARCQWIITAPAGKGLSFRATRFSLEYSASCSYDALSINGEKFCGFTGPAGFVSDSPATVSFTTDGSATYIGFEVEITVADKPTIGSCGGEVVVESGKTSWFLSPRHPMNYPDNSRCSWTISGPAGKGLQFDSSFFLLENGCSYDSLTFTETVNGQSVQLGKVCGSSGPNLRSATNFVTAEFVSDSSQNFQGFNITVKVDNCPGQGTCRNNATVCISASQYCDGVADCPDNLDEQFCNAECGIPPIAPNLELTRLSDKIVGGAEAVPHSWPWQIAFTSASGFQFCGGSLIDRNWVLTAAHCCDGESPSSSRVRVGTHNLNAQEDSSKIIRIKRIIEHPQYNSGTFANDFCLLELEEPAEFGLAVVPACLGNAADNVPGTRCYLSGWGNTGPRTTFGAKEYKRLVGVVEDGRLPQSAASFLRGTTVLHQVDVNLITLDACNAAYGSGRIEPNMICGQAPGKDSCQGDSGGPLVCPRADGQPGFVLVGVTSWGYGCARPTHPGVYGRVAHVRDWITNTMFS